MHGTTARSGHDPFVQLWTSRSRFTKLVASRSFASTWRGVLVSNRRAFSMAMAAAGDNGRRWIRVVKKTGWGQAQSGEHRSCS